MENCPSLHPRHTFMAPQAKTLPRLKQLLQEEEEESVIINNKRVKRWEECSLDYIILYRSFSASPVFLLYVVTHREVIHAHTLCGQKYVDNHVQILLCPFGLRLGSSMMWRG